MRESEREREKVGEKEREREGREERCWKLRRKTLGEFSI